MYFGNPGCHYSRFSILQVLNKDGYEMRSATDIAKKIRERRYRKEF